LARNHPEPGAVAELRRRDPVLAEALDRVPPFPGFPDPRGSGSHFHALARAIVYQQLAGSAAAAIHGRVLALTPGPSFPTPEQCLEIPDRDFRAVGLSRSKTRSLKDLANRVVTRDVRLRSISRRTDDEIIAELTQVWGIGRWTAQIFLMFRLGRLDVMPAGDLGIREGMRRLDGMAERPAPTQVLERAEAWRPLRSVAAWVLWRVVDSTE
jgi:3-methyladenine DNA glycosylase/8-oxoguanine DNA glycosylase